MAVVSDRLASALQQFGRGSVIGLTLADILLTVDQLGLDPSRVVINGGYAVAIKPRETAGQS